MLKQRNLNKQSKKTSKLNKLQSNNNAMLKMNFDFVEFQPKRNDFRNEKKKITNVRTRKEFRKMKIKE